MSSIPSMVYHNPKTVTGWICLLGWTQQVISSGHQLERLQPRRAEVSVLLCLDLLFTLLCHSVTKPAVLRGYQEAAVGSVIEAINDGTRLFISLGLPTNSGTPIQRQGRAGCPCPAS